MRRAGTLLMVVGAVAVVIGIAGWLLGRARWQPPAPVKPALPEIAVVQASPTALGQHALKSPLFWSSRAPVEAGEASAEPAAAESEMAQLRLMAVLESGGQRVALLQRPDRTVLKLDSAQPEGEWRLESFDGLVAVLVSTKGQRVERVLERTNAAPVAQPGQKAPSVRSGPSPGNSGLTQGQPPTGGAAAPSVATPPAASGGLHPVRPGAHPQAALERLLRLAQLPVRRRELKTYT